MVQFKSAGDSSAAIKQMEEDDDLEVEKARLLSLAQQSGFDEQSAKKCLDRLVDLYGTSIFNF